MMRIPVDAEVFCTDGLWGHSTCLIVNPITNDMTHVVVREHTGSDNECLVPLDLIMEATTHTIKLSCSKEELTDLPAFIRSHFVAQDISSQGDNQNYLVWPLVTYHSYEHAEDHIPLGELKIHKGAEVSAVDGSVGIVSEFVVKENGKHITHMILDASQMEPDQHIVVPLSDIQHIEDDHVYLKLTCDEIEQLPHYHHAIY